jgi:endonuclease/exonuclease/phosphatase family metal-dependent hydrolase
VLAGDFNLDPVWASRLRIRSEVATFDRLREGYVDAARAAGPTLLGLLRVDHVLIRKPPPGSWRAHVARDRRLPRGDHAPVVLDVVPVA